jgi:type III restriction enzyme
MPDLPALTTEEQAVYEWQMWVPGMGDEGQRKLKAALAWCERINALDPEHRQGLPWHYVLLSEPVVLEWQAKGAHLAELLDYARLRPLAQASLQQSLL